MNKQERLRLVDALIPVACRLVGAVRDGDRDDVAGVLAEVPGGRQDALLVVVAAMVDPDRSPGELLAWASAPRDVNAPSMRGLRAIEVPQPILAADPDEPPIELPGEREFGRLLEAGVPPLTASHMVDAVLRCLRAA